LKDEIDRSAEVDRPDGCRHMAKTAGLCRNVEALPEVVEKGDDTHIVLHAIGRRIDPDHRVAGAEQEAVEQAGSNAPRIVGRMIRLEPGRKSAGQSDRVAECGDDAAFGGDNDEVLQAHDFRHRGGHLPGHARSQRSQAVRARPRVEQPFSELADGQVGYRREGPWVVTVLDQPGNFVVFIGNKIDLQEGLEGKVGQRRLRRDALDGALRRDAGQCVSGSRRRGFGEKGLEIRESPTHAIDCRFVGHGQCLMRPVAQKRSAGFLIASRADRRRSIPARRRRSAASGQAHHQRGGRLDRRAQLFAHLTRSCMESLERTHLCKFFAIGDRGAVSPNQRPLEEEVGRRFENILETIGHTPVVKINRRRRQSSSLTSSKPTKSRASGSRSDTSAQPATFKSP
jgi:hypothetical protein